jgi:hypothetical protein
MHGEGDHRSNSSGVGGTGVFVPHQSAAVDASTATAAVPSTANNSPLQSIGGAAEISRQNSSSVMSPAQDSVQGHMSISLSAFRAVFGEDVAAAERALNVLAPTALRQQLLALRESAAAAIAGQQEQQQQQQQQQETGGVEESSSAVAAAAAAAATSAVSSAKGGEDLSKAAARSSRTKAQLFPTQAGLALDSTSSSQTPAMKPSDSKNAGDESESAAATAAAAHNQQLPSDEMLWDLLDILHSQLFTDQAATATDTQAEGADGQLLREDERQQQQQQEKRSRWWRANPPELLLARCDGEGGAAQELQLVAAAGKQLVMQLAGGNNSGVLTLEVIGRAAFF